MLDQKKQAIVKLIKDANELDLISVLLLSNSASALKAKEKLDKLESEKSSDRKPEDIRRRSRRTG